MVMVRLLYFVAGYLVVRVEGQWLERFVNLLISNDIYVWDVETKDGFMRLKMGIAAFLKVRPYARRARCGVRIEKKVGAPFLLRGLQERTALTAGLFFFIVMVYLLTSVVWVVRVTGLENVSPEQVMDIARQRGLVVGARKRTLDLKEIERDLVLNLRGLTWAKVRVQGTVYTIEVIEKAKEPDRQEVDGPCDIVANKAGTIVSLLVLMGQATVREGMRVHAGQVLVSGALYGTPVLDSRLGAPPIPGVAKYLRARAIVRARTSYEAYREEPLTRVELKRTGRTHTAVMIKIGRTSTIWRVPGVVFSLFDIESEPVLPWLGRNTTAFVEVHQLTYHELAPYDRTISPREAKELAQAAAAAAAQNAMPPEAERVRVRSEVFEMPGVIGVRVTIDAIENIGVARPVGGY